MKGEQEEPDDRGGSAAAVTKCALTPAEVTQLRDDVAKARAVKKEAKRSQPLTYALTEEPKTDKKGVGASFSRMLFKAMRTMAPERAYQIGENMKRQLVEAAIAEMHGGGGSAAATRSPVDQAASSGGSAPAARTSADQAASSGRPCPCCG